MADQWVHGIFAWAPWVIGAAIVLVAYLATRGQSRAEAPIGQTFACAKCGRRDKREHMVPIAHQGAVSWYCSRCAGH